MDVSTVRRWVMGFSNVTVMCVTSYVRVVLHKYEPTKCSSLIKIMVVWTLLLSIGVTVLALYIVVAVEINRKHL